MQSVWDHVRLAAERTPELPAMVDDRTARRLTYGELVLEVETVAAGFAEAGIVCGERVAIILPNRWDHAITLLALHRLGAVPCLLNPRLKPDEVGNLLGRSGVSAAICLPEPLLLERIRQALPRGGKRFCAGGVVRGAMDLSDCRGDPRRLVPWNPPDPDAVSLILYTSGTTGLPKGVMLPHRVTDARVIYLLAQCGIRHGRHNRSIGLMPLFHAVGFYSAFLTILSMNGCYFVHSGFDPAAATKIINNEAITFVYGTPAHFHAMLETPEGTVPMESVETLVYAAAVMPEATLRRMSACFPRARITNIYGTTEVMNALYMPDPVGRGLSLRPGFYSNVRIGRIGGTVHDLCRDGEEGEILVDAAAEATFSGYLDDPEATAGKLVDGWYRTGDIGAWTGNGDLELRGRVDDMIVSGGENIHPEEVEAVLLRHDKVRDAAVIGMPDERWSERVVACVVGEEATARDLDLWCRRSSLADYKRPRDYVFLKELPRNASSKVLRRQLKVIACERLTAA